MSAIKLSILILTVPNRVGESFLSLVNHLQTQIDLEKTNAVEILGLFDNKKRTVGEKRQALLQIANGSYLVFIDDDDRVADTYIKDILLALKDDPDCVVFDCLCTMNNTKRIYCKYGIEYEYKDTDQDGNWFGKPAHTMVYRAAIAKKHHYQSVSVGEDVEWVKRACNEIKKQNRISKVLYYYDYNDSTSETRGPRSFTTLKRKLPAVELINKVAAGFWDNMHSSTDKYWLTGSTPKQVIEAHKVTSEFNTCKSFLDIGVGFGDMSRHAKAQGKYVVACDISSIALSKLKGVADETHNLVCNAPAVDLAVCHLVFQHCDNSVVASIIRDIKLKPNGLFSFQFACLRPGEAANSKVATLLTNKTHYLRSLNEIKQFIVNGGKDLVAVSEPKDFYGEENLRWYFCKVQNKGVVAVAPQKTVAAFAPQKTVVPQTPIIKTIISTDDAFTFFSNELRQINIVKKIVDTLDEDYLTHQCFNPLKEVPTISIVMTVRNRSTQTYFTLTQIHKQYVSNIQVIIVEDSTTDVLKESILQNFAIHIDYIKIRNKFWVNPCVNYNIGFKYIKAKKTIIQNSEVCHIGKVLDYAIQKLQPKTYLAFDVLALPKQQENTQFHANMNAFMKKVKKANNYPWYQHTEKRNAYLHFLSAIMTEDLKDVGGFDLDFSMATCFDDPAFVEQLKNHKIQLIAVPNDDYALMGIHQWHQAENPKMTTKNVFNQNLLFAKQEYFKKNGKYLNLKTNDDVIQLFG